MQPIIAAINVNFWISYKLKLNYGNKVKKRETENITRPLEAKTMEHVGCVTTHAIE